MSDRRPFTTRKRVLPLWAMALAGAAALVVAVVLAGSTASFMATAERTEGSVRGVTSEIITSSSNGTTSRKKVFTATVFFSAADGSRISFESSAGTRSPDYEVGDTVPVAYNPDDPEDARIASFWSAYRTPLGVGAAGLSLIVIAGISSALGRRQASSRQRGAAQPPPAQPPMGGGDSGYAGYPDYPGHHDHPGRSHHPGQPGYPSQPSDPGRNAW